MNKIIKGIRETLGMVEERLIEPWEVILQEICDNHEKMSNEDLDSILIEYYKSIPYNCSVNSPYLNEIIMSRFEEGTHWKRYTITLK